MYFARRTVKGVQIYEKQSFNYRFNNFLVEIPKAVFACPADNGNEVIFRENSAYMVPAAFGTE